MLPTCLPSQAQNCAIPATGFRGSKRVSRKASIAGINRTDSKKLSLLDVKSLSVEAAAEMQERQIRDLFTTYDFLQEGELSKEAFFHVHGLTAALSNSCSTPRLPPIEVGRPGAAQEASILRRRKSVPVLRPSRPVPVPSAIWAKFAEADRMDFAAFRSWLLESHPLETDLHRARLQQQFLASSIKELKLRLSSPRVEAWKALDAAVKAAKQLRESKPLESVHMLQDAIRRARGFAIPGILEHENLLDWWERGHQQSLVNRLAVSYTIKDLQNALQALEDCPVKLEMDLIQTYREQLVSWQKPFILHVTTMAGSEASVEVSRTETIASVFERASKQLEVKEYRLTLVSTTRNCKLEPPSATLEELGIRAHEEVLASFGEVDRWEELSIPEFLDLATSLGVLRFEDAVEQQSKFGSGLLKRQDVQTQALIAKIESKEKALRELEERQRRRAEEERKKREQMRNELVARASEGYVHMAKGMQSHYDELLREAHMIKNDVQADLDEALPDLMAAFDELQLISKQDLQEVRCLRSPPRPVKLTMQALCILFGVRPCLLKDESKGVVEDYWRPALKMLSDGGFLQSMLQFDKDNLCEIAVSQLLHFIYDDDLSPDVVCKCSVFCAAACAWVRSIIKYHFVARAVAPKKAFLRDKESQLEQIGMEKDILAELMKEVDIVA